MTKKILNFKYGKKSHRDKFVGFWCSKQSDELVNLYSAAYESTKSKVLRGIVLKWIDDNYITETVLIKKITKDIQVKYLEMRNEISYNEFIECIKKELKQKNISAALIENITNKIQPCKGQQKKNL